MLTNPVMTDLFLSRTHFKTSSIAKRWIFERDEEGEQKILRCSPSYIEGFFAKADEVLSQKASVAAEEVLKWVLSMYTLDIICSNGHPFEGWFTNREAFEGQRDLNLITCPICSDTHAQQAISPVRVKKHIEKEDTPTKPAKKEKKTNILEFIEKHFEDVGPKFADEAIRIHVGDSEGRNIRGTATKDEEKMLSDEGVSFFKLPEFQ